jgi:hypothetical protein
MIAKHGGTIVLSGHLKFGSIYVLDMITKRSNIAVSASIWHKRMGHLNMNYLQKLPTMANGIELKQKDGDIKCETCIQSKITRHSFTSKVEKYDTPGTCFSIDLGFISQQAYDDSRCYATYTDNASNLTIIFIMKAKSEQFECFKEVYSYSLAQTGNMMKEIILDNAGENLSNDMIDFCKDKGVQIINTSAYTPEQNGIAERKNRT